MRKILAYVFVLLIASLVVSFPFFRPGYFPSHDGEWAVVRLGAMHRAVLDNHIPARWAGNQNFTYGYPLFHFTYPLPYYMGEIFNLSGLGLIESVKAVFILSVVGSALGMFLLGRELFGNFGGLVTSVFYLFAPYRLVNLYVRGSIGESLSLAFFPFLFLVLIKFYKKKDKRLLVIFSLLFAALLITHNVTALIFSVFLGVFSLFLIFKDRSLLKPLALGYLVGFMLSSFFLVPALVEKGYIILGSERIADLGRNFVSIDRLFFPSWNFGAYGALDGFSPQVGPVHLIALILSSIFIFSIKSKKFEERIAIFSVISFLALVVLMLPFSKPFWETLPLFSNVDFPWRLLTPAIFFLCIPLGALAKNRIGKFVLTGFLVVLVLWNYKYISPQKYIYPTDDYYLTNEATTTSNDELMPVWVKEKPTSRPAEKIEVKSGKAQIELLESNSIYTKFEVKTDEQSRLAINTIYFPGWEVLSDGKPLGFSYDNPKGIMEIDVPEGNKTIELKFNDTPVRQFSNILSIGGLLSLIVISRIKIFK